MENLKPTDWNGYRKLDFTVGGRDSFIVCPKTEAPGRPWVWRCEFFGAFDTADRALLRMGYHLAYHHVSDMYGCPESVEMMHEFYTEVTETFDLARQTVLFGFSRGGMYAVNYAARYPYETAAIYLDAPVLDIRSWPCGPGGNEKCAAECMKLYGVTPETLPSFEGSPMKEAEWIAKNKIPVIIVAGGADKCVPYSENGEIFAARVRAAGGVIETIVKPNCDHHPHSLEDPRPITDFIAEHTDFAPRLPNAQYRLKVEKRLTVGFIGGSITDNTTNGYGWRPRAVEYLRTHYPDAEITEIQAAIGGTGSEFGMYRCEWDLISGAPDLVFIEFALNDSGDFYPDGEPVSGACTETIIRKLREKLPYTEIVLTFTLNKGIRDGMDSGRPYASRDAQTALARVYGLPTVNIGDAMWRAVKHEYGGDWIPLTKGDCVHPNETGYTYCTREMTAFLDEALRGDCRTLTRYACPDPINSKHVVMSAHLEDAYDAETEGFLKIDQPLLPWRPYKHYLEGHPGDALRFTFTGTTVGILNTLPHDGGKFYASVDGGEEICRMARDSYSKHFDRIHYMLLFSGLTPGEHTLRIRAEDAGDPDDPGNVVRIGAFLVS